MAEGGYHSGNGNIEKILTRDSASQTDKENNPDGASHSSCRWRCPHGERPAHYAPAVEYLFVEPYDCKENRQHVEAARTELCELCGAPPMDQPDGRFGLLANCAHCFCYRCVKAWRLALPRYQQPEFECPVCAAVSDLVCPSAVWLEAAPAKRRLLADYRRHRQQTPCKYFGAGYCNYGHKCVYAHDTIAPTTAH